MKRLVFSLFAVLFAISACAVTLPDVTLRDVDGNEVAVESLGKTGKPVIISFFATWCKPCMQELKAFDDVYADWQDETGVEMYIVSIDKAQDSHKVKALVDGNGWDFHVLLDPNEAFSKPMNVQPIPHMFVIDSKGNIVYNHVGYIDGDETKVRKLLK